MDSNPTWVLFFLQYPSLCLYWGITTHYLLLLLQEEKGSRVSMGTNLLKNKEHLLMTLGCS